MANVRVCYGNYAALPSQIMGKGDEHDWKLSGFAAIEAIAVTAHPAAHTPPASLDVIDVESEDDVDGRHFYFTVRNIGPNELYGYTIAITLIAG